MAFKGDPSALMTGVALALGGAAMTGAWQHALWASVAGALLVIVCLLARLWIGHAALSPPRDATLAAATGEETMPLRLLLDQLPTPLVGIQSDGARALNRAARALFATQDHIAPVPDPLLSPAASRLAHAGRHWRIDRVEASGTTGARTILALIDIEAEERTGEARAAAEMIQVMGHEVLNGLAPIASLAESGLAAWQQSEAQRALLMPDILATLARRAESLQRFTEAYRTLARLPEPTRAPIAMDDFMGDLTLLFAGRWRSGITLRVEPGPDGASFMADRDQLTQAVWALLQNAAEAALDGQQTPWVGFDITCEKDRILILVSDSGKGVASAERGKIFHPFHTTKPNGTGIGLSLSRHIARGHRGDLYLRETLPTTFVVALPQDG